MDSNTKDLDYVQWFRQTTPYINAHRGKRFVIHIDGETIESPIFQHICHDICLLNSLGIELIVVYGLRPQIDAILQKNALCASFHHSMRVTDSDTMILIEQISGQVRGQIEARLSMGLPNSPMEGSKIRVLSGNIITARPIGVKHGVDYQHTGSVRRVKAESLNLLLSQNTVVLIPPVGVSSTGETFNLCALEVALATAAAISADKLIFLSALLPAPEEPGALPRELSADQATRLLVRENKHSADSRDLLERAVEACQAGVDRVHLLDSRQNGALLEELFTLDGAGTLLMRDDYENLRTATIQDIPGMLDIIRPLEEKGILIPRGREHLELEIDNYVILERDSFVIACAGLYPYSQEHCAEVGCFAIDLHYQNQGRGKKILRQLETMARERQIETLFVITTQTTHWFLEQGFKPTRFEELPQKKRAEYDLRRNPKVLTKTLKAV
jgi:amino-acid N-acetyltransferase